MYSNQVRFNFQYDCKTSTEDVCKLIQKAQSRENLLIEKLFSLETSDPSIFSRHLKITWCNFFVCSLLRMKMWFFLRPVKIFVIKTIVLSNVFLYREKLAIWHPFTSRYPVYTTSILIVLQYITIVSIVVHSFLYIFFYRKR